MTYIKPSNNARSQKIRKRYFPFNYLMNSKELNGVGANIAKNCELRDGMVAKTKGEDLLLTLAGISGYLYAFEYTKTDGTTQVIAIYKSGSIYLLRAIEEDGTVVVPGTEATTTKTGTVSLTSGGSAVVGSGTLFTTEFSVGDSVRTDPSDALYRKILTISDDTHLTFDTAWSGSTQAGADIILVTNPKGIGDVDFTSSLFDWDQVQSRGFIMNNSLSTPLYMWDGASLAAVASTSAIPIRSPIWASSNGNRVSLGFLDKKPLASGDEIETSSSFSSGASVHSGAEYSTGIPRSTGAISTPSGMIMFGVMGGERQNIRENYSSNDVDSNTRSLSFGYNGKGVLNSQQICLGDYYIYIINDTGIIEIDQKSGRSRNLTEDGKIAEYFKKYDKTAATIKYDAIEQKVVALVENGARNDTLLIVDVSQRKKPVSISDNHYYSSLLTIKGSVHGCSAIDGKIIKLFSGLADWEGNSRAYKFITEWNAFNGIQFKKTLKQISIFASVNPGKTFYVRLYKNGSTTHFYEEELEAKVLPLLTGTSAPFSKYVLGIGAADLVVTNKDDLNLFRKNEGFLSLAIEVFQDSADDFVLQDIMVEYKTANKLSKDLTMPTSLFS